eukprot:gene11135-13638_t
MILTEHILSTTWSWSMIFGSFLVSVLGCYTSLQILTQLTVTSSRWRREFYFILGSISQGGCGIWSMHFVGMMALHMDVSVTFNTFLTILSGVIAIVSCRLGLLFLTMRLPEKVKSRLGDDQPLLINIGMGDDIEFSNSKNRNSDLTLESCKVNNSTSNSPILFNRKFQLKSFSRVQDKPLFMQSPDQRSEPINLQETIIDIRNTPNFTSTTPNTNNQQQCSNLPVIWSSPDVVVHQGTTQSTQPYRSSQSLEEEDEIDKQIFQSMKWYHKLYYKLKSMIPLSIRFRYNQNTLVRLILGSLFFAIGVCGMHYTGMQAMEMNAYIVYNEYIVILSFIIAWITTFVGLNICAFAYSHVQHFISALIMALAVCGMHYTGMLSATYYHSDESSNENGTKNEHFFIAMAIFGISLVVCFLFIAITSSANQKLRDSLIQLASELNYEKNKTEHLLNSILPTPVSNKMKSGEINVAEECHDISILFADIVDFTKISAHYSAKDLVQMLNRIYSLFDDLTESMKLEKIKTIGDSYMVVSGLPWHEKENFITEESAGIPYDGPLNNQQLPSKYNASLFNSEKAVIFAAYLMDLVEYANRRYGYDINLRIGINTGDAIAGVIGKKKYTFDLWGDSVNIASRMESSGTPGKINVSESVYQQLKNRYPFEPQSINVKGKGYFEEFEDNPEIEPFWDYINDIPDWVANCKRVQCPQGYYCSIKNNIAICNSLCDIYKCPPGTKCSLSPNGGSIVCTPTNLSISKSN